jgi:hypothetical protein
MDTLTDTAGNKYWRSGSAIYLRLKGAKRDRLLGQVGSERTLYITRRPDHWHVASGMWGFNRFIMVNHAALYFDRVRIICTNPRGYQVTGTLTPEQMLAMFATLHFKKQGFELQGFLTEEQIRGLRPAVAAPRKDPAPAPEAAQGDLFGVTHG